jgi:hypothetical protein
MIQRSALAAFEQSKHGVRAVDEQTAEITISSFANPTEARLATG